MLVRAILHASLLSVAASWVLPGTPPANGLRRRRALPRTAAPIACAPFRSDADFDYFRRSQELTIELTKPLGAVLEALPDGGVQVADVVEGGSASATGLLKKRDKLTDICGTDVAGATFDETMEALTAADAELTLGISRTMIVKVKREVVPPPYLTIVGGNSGEVIKGTNLRTAIQASKSQLYRGTDKLTNCGGVGQCRSCIVKVIEGDDQLSDITDAEKRILAKNPGCRLACQALVNGNVEIEVCPKV